MADDIAALGIRIDSLQVELAEDRLKRLTNSGRSAETQVTALGRAFKTAAIGVAAIGISALTASIGVATKSWLDFDKAIKEVNSITGQSREEFAHFRKEVLEVATAMGVDAAVAARGLYETLSAGVPKENAIAFLSVAAKTAVAGVTEVDTAVNALTNVFNAFGVSSSRAEEVADKFLQTVNDGKTTFPQMAQNIADASVPMATLGGSFEELFAQISQITSKGVATSAAFTQVRASINALLNPSDEMAEALRQMGFQSGRAAVEAQGFAGTMNRLREIYNGNDAALFKAVRSSEAFNQVLATTGSQAQSTAKFLDNINNSAGNVSKAGKINADVLGNALIELKNSAVSLVETMEGSLRIIGIFSEALRGAAELIRMVTPGSVTAATDAIGKSASNFGGVAAATTLQQGIRDLEAKRAELQRSLANAQNVPLGAGSQGAGYAIGSITGELNQNAVDLKALQDQYEGLDSSIKETGESLRDLKKIEDEINNGTLLPEKGAIEAAKINSELDLQIQKETLLNQINDEEARLAVETAKANEKRATDAQTAIEKEQKASEEQAESDKKRLDLAKQLGENRREILESQIKELEMVKLTNGATEEQVRFADAGIEKLKMELYLLDEKGNKIEKAKAVSGGGTSASSATRIAELHDFEPIFELPTQNLFDELAKQEADVLRSYTKRKADILALTGITEEERAALILKTNQELAEANDHFDRERYKASLTTASDFFGNLSTIAGAFGKKGHKIAQAAAIAQTTIKTYESATSAYASLAGIPYVGPALGAAAAGAAIAAGFVNIAKIKSTEYAGAFEGGGFVRGNSFTGDRMTASVNSGELILNQNQQKNLFDMANGNKPEASQGLTIIVQNLPGQDSEITQDGDRVSIKTVEATLGRLSMEARQGGGKVFPAFAQSHGLKRKG